MEKYSVAILIWVCQLLSLFDGVSADCVKMNSCSCQTDEGIVDLSPLASSTPLAQFSDVVDTQGKYLFSWNPCTSFSEGTNCNQVAGCQISFDHSATYPIGTQDSAQFTGDLRQDNLQLTYTAMGNDGMTRTTIVHLVCGPTGSGDILSVVGETAPLTYVMRLTSPHSCVIAHPTVPPPITMSPNVIPKHDLKKIESLLLYILIAIGVGVIVQLLVLVAILATRRTESGNSTSKIKPFDYGSIQVTKD